MSEIFTGLGERALTFLLSTGGLFFVGMLLLAALTGLIRGRNARLRILCGVILILCLLYGFLLLWLSIGFGGSGHSPTPVQP